MLKVVERYRVSDVPASPTMILFLLKSDLTNKYDLSSLRRFLCGGAPLSKEVAEKFKRKFPQVEITQGYGLTEAGAVSRMIGPEESNQHPSVGRLNPNMEAKIVDPLTGEAIGPGKRGELWLRGPSIMKGYVGDEKETAECLDSEGWLKTGDLSFFDSDGFLYIVDRLKELIKYKAYQVPPFELEQLLLSNPEVADAAVIPYPDEEAGQIPMAYVVRKPGSKITEAEIMDSIAKQVAPYKKIRRVAFISAIPKSPAGKILRRDLVNHALSASYGSEARPERRFLAEAADLLLNIIYCPNPPQTGVTCIRRHRCCLHTLDLCYHWPAIGNKVGVFMELVDEMLRTEVNIKEAVIKVKLAQLCTNVSPEPGPTMSEAVSKLERTKSCS
ncbi:hypothetical protein OIU77_000395 [Salix suchowensis]|uniref:Uncharacterized protein n=1 Tax=Salix suchowensis TaxID=1278906 RepID=A0ABQ9B960_9ROSI|nr:hypothetical protein OIU77_000395 [Salix suchowensis]